MCWVGISSNRLAESHRIRGAQSPFLSDQAPEPVRASTFPPTPPPVGTGGYLIELYLKGVAGSNLVHFKRVNAKVFDSPTDSAITKVVLTQAVLTWSY